MKDLFTIVVADDEAELREAVCQMIEWEKIGYRLVGSAGNGLDALQLVEQLQPDLLLTDIRMPFISGTELARQVRELRPLTQIAFLSGYDDFEYAQQAIACNVVSYMLKPISMAELTRVLTEIHKKIATQYRAFQAPAGEKRDWRDFLVPLLLDGYSDAQRQDEKILAASAVRCGLISSAQQPLQMAVLAMEVYENGINCTTAELTQPVNMILEKYYRPCSFFSGGRILTLLLGDNLTDLNFVLEELVQAVCRVMRMRCRVGVSRRFSMFSKCRSACREAIDALLVTGQVGSGVYRISDVPSASGGASLGEHILRLESVLRSGSQTELEKAIGALFQQAGPDADLAALQAEASVFRMMYAAGSEENIAVLSRRCRKQGLLFHNAKPETLRRSTLELCLMARDLIADQRKEGVSLMCQQALEQINCNYMDELLSLGSVSENLHVSPNYLSANMKKHEGDTFINLLIKKRMEVAGDLLSTTNLKILEVARRCGYSDQHYFSYCFKKFHGVSPVVLRRQSQDGKEQS
ncbi:MAG: response regulator [Oscillospiraceae bacterium]|nr:response regulator [Oscillospiraceae bacterium]